MSERTSLARRAFAFADRHLAALLSAAVIVQAGLGVMIFSRLDLQTALAVVQEQGATSIALGQVIRFATLAPPAVIGFTAVAPAFRKRVRSFSIGRRTAWVLCAASLVFLFATQPTAYALAIPLMSLFFVWVIGQFQSRVAAVMITKRGRAGVSDATGVAETRERLERWKGPLLAGWIVYMVILVASGNWLPSERLELSDGTTMTAYVLSSNSSETVVARDKPREIVRIDTEQIESRKVCATTDTAVLGPFADRMLGLFGGSPYEPCGDPN